MYSPHPPEDAVSLVPTEQPNRTDVPSVWRALAPVALCLASAAIVVLVVNLI